MQDAQEIQNTLRSTRQAQGLTIAALAVRAGVSPTTICTIEKYGYVPQDATREKIANGLGLAIGEIWGPA